MRVAHRLRRVAIDLADGPEAKRRTLLKREVERAVSELSGDDRQRFLAELRAHFPCSEDDIPAADFAPVRATEAPPPQAPSDTGDSRSSQAAADEEFENAGGSGGVEPIEELPTLPPVAADEPDATDPADGSLVELEELSELEALPEDDAPIAEPAVEPTPPPPPPPASPSPSPAGGASADMAGFTMIGDAPPAGLTGPSPQALDEAGFTVIGSADLPQHHGSDSGADMKAALDVGASDPGAGDSPLPTLIETPKTRATDDDFEPVQPARKENASPARQLSEAWERLASLRGTVSDAAWQSSLEQARAKGLIPSGTAANAPAPAPDFAAAEAECRRRWNVGGDDRIDPTKLLKLVDLLVPHVAATDRYGREVLEKIAPARGATLIDDGTAGPASGLTPRRLYGFTLARTRSDEQRLRRDAEHGRRLVTGLVGAMQGLGSQLANRVLGRLHPERIKAGGTGTSAGWLGGGEKAAKADWWDQYEQAFDHLAHGDGSALDDEVARIVHEFVAPTLNLPPG